MSKKILITEDDPNVLSFIQFTLEEKGYQVLLAKDGLEGLQKTQDEHPDLIILDIMLPGLDGYEVCHRLRQKPETANVPILMLSARARQEDKDIGRRMGADDYLAKPVGPSEIRGRVEALLTSVQIIHEGES